MADRPDKDRFHTPAAEQRVTKPSDVETAELRRIFESCDPNGDGFIDRQEFHVLLNRLDGDVSRAESLLDFEVADTEGDGFIGFKEFIAWWTN